MKALTLWQPYAWAMAWAGKPVENRTWKPSHAECGQLLAIHAGKRFDRQAIDDIAEEFAVAPEGYPILDSVLREFEESGEILRRVGNLDLGAVVAVGWLAGWVAEGSTPSAHLVLPPGYQHDEHEVVKRAILTDWYQGPFGWVVLNRRALPEPVPCCGAQGIWTLPPEVEAEVRRQLEVPHG